MLGRRISTCPILRDVFNHVEISSQDVFSLCRFLVFRKIFFFFLVYWVPKMFVIFSVQVSISIFMATSLPALSECLYVVLNLFELLLQNIATPHLRLFNEEKKAAPSHSFFHSFSSCCVLCVSCNSISHIFSF